ncbi:MAG: replication endonuclease [Pseudomonadota bacterium]
MQHSPTQRLTREEYFSTLREIHSAYKSVIGQIGADAILEDIKDQWAGDGYCYSRDASENLRRELSYAKRVKKIFASFVSRISDHTIKKSVIHTLLNEKDGLSRIERIAQDETVLSAIRMQNTNISDIRERARQRIELGITDRSELAERRYLKRKIQLGRFRLGQATHAIGSQGMSIVTDGMLKFRKADLAMQAAWSSKQEIKHIVEDPATGKVIRSETFPLTDVIESSKEARNNETIALIKGWTEFAKNNGFALGMLTLTLRGEWHPTPKYKSKNHNWNGKFGDEALVELNRLWKKVAKKKENQGFEWSYWRGGEAQEDGTPHLHIAFAIPAEQLLAFIDSVFEVFPNANFKIDSANIGHETKLQILKLEKELNTPSRTLIELNKKTGEGAQSFTSYLLKYAVGFTSEKSAGDTFERNECYRSAIGMRGYQPAGMPARAWWQAMRKIELSDIPQTEKWNDFREAVYCAKNPKEKINGIDAAARWIELCGGLGASRKARPFFLQESKSRDYFPDEKDDETKYKIQTWQLIEEGEPTEKFDYINKGWIIQKSDIEQEKDSPNSIVNISNIQYKHDVGEVIDTYSRKNQPPKPQPKTSKTEHQNLSPSPGRQGGGVKKPTPTPPPLQKLNDPPPPSSSSLGDRGTARFAARWPHHRQRLNLTASAGLKNPHP